MNPAVTCQRCGAPLSTFADDGLCPACMLQSAFEVAADPGLVPPTRLALPRTFGGYLLLEEIGRGGMGIVYRARQPSLDRTVALKLLLGGVYSSEAMLRRFQIEAAAAAALRHPGIVAIHDFGESEGQPFYTMDLMQGRNLAQISDGRPLESRHAARYLRIISDAVHFAHGRGILHRDLKPSNILIDYDDHPRVADFGTAKRLGAGEGVTMTGQVVGSPNYAAPEQVSGGEAEVGVPADIYALGALLYHLLTGRPPFLAASLEETLRLLHDTEPIAPRDLNPAVPRDLETICLKCLAKDPARRYPTAAALVEDLDRFLGDRPVKALPPGLVERMRKYARRNRAVVIAAAVVFVSLAVGLGLALAGYRQAVAQQRATQAARAQAEELVGVIMRDAQPALEPYGRRPVLGKIAEASLHYFEQLPPELQNASTRAAQAASLDSLAVVREQERDGQTGRIAKRRALDLWRKAAAEHPDDPEAAAALLLDEIDGIRWFGPRLVDDTLRMQVELIARIRDWQQRFPDHARLKYCLARALTLWSLDAERNGVTDGIVAGAQEAHRLLQPLLQETPDDPNTRATYLTSFQSLGLAYTSTGNLIDGLHVLEDGVAFAEEALKKDPGNETLLIAAAEISGSLSSAVEPQSARRARDIERTARDHLATLVQFDPSNRSGRLSYAKSFWHEVNFLRRDGQLAAARQILTQIETLMKSTGDLRQLRASEAPGGPQGAIYEAGRQQAECAALMGDRTDAKAWLAVSATRCSQIREWAADNPAGADFVAALLWNTRIKVALSLRDWPAAERLAGETITAIDAMPAAAAWDVVVQIRAMAVRALGQAKLRQGDAAGAIPLLQKAQAVLQDADETLGEAFAATGNAVQAQKVLRTSLASREADYQREPELWEIRRNLAHASFLLARALDPAGPDTSVQRRALLDRASALLNGPEAEARLTAGDREMKADVAALGSG